MGGPRHTPEHGAAVAFLSGGTALQHTARALKAYTHRTLHLVTPFDSGGSSGSLRRAFRMPSVGDLRSRLLALIDERPPESDILYRWFAHRISAECEGEARRALDTLQAEGERVCGALSADLRAQLQTYLSRALQNLPADFDARGASVGNLILTGCYLANERNIDLAIDAIAQRLRVLGWVRPTAHADLHLAARLQNGARVIGQHRLGGKGSPALTAPIEELYLVRSLEDASPQPAASPPETLARLRVADMICFPIGSFFTSIVANLLPRGVGRTLCESRGIKVYVPNLGRDPEQLGMRLSDTVQTLVRYVGRDLGSDPPVERVIQYVLVDRRRGHYAMSLDLERLRGTGIEVIDRPLACRFDGSRVDPELLARALISMSGAA